jgi:uncharacterized protein (DUF486 family)
MVQVPANRIGFAANGGLFNLWQLESSSRKCHADCFSVFTLTVFRNETFRDQSHNRLCITIPAVYFIFKK